MKRLINWVLIKLGLRKKPVVGWKYYGGYARAKLGEYDQMGWTYTHHTYNGDGEEIE